MTRHRGSVGTLRLCVDACMHARGQRTADAGAWGTVDVVVVRVVQDEVGARRHADVDEEDVEDDAKVHRHVRRARLAWPVQVRVRQRQGEGEGVWGGRHARKAHA